MSSKTFSILPNNSLEWIKSLIGLAFLLQVFISLPLWLGLQRTFPLVPLVGDEAFFNGDFFKFLLFGALILGGLGLVFYKNIQLSTGFFLVVMLTFFMQDVTRLQAWTYQYFMMVSLLFLHHFHKNKALTIVALQIIMVCTYAWSGIQKINYYFPELVFSWMMEAYPFLKPLIEITWLGFVVAGFEALLGVGLFFQKTRKITLWLSTGFHVIILALLIGLDWNAVVYPWNVLMIALLWLLFSESVSMNLDNEKNQNATFNTTFNPSFNPIFPTIKKAKTITERLSIYSVILLFGIMPLFNFLNVWDDYLSLKMYSGVGDTADVYFDSEDLNCVPETAQNDIYYKEEADEMRISMDDWAFNELKVPAYSNRKMYKKVGQKYCECLDNVKKGGIEIIGTPRWTLEEYSYKFSCLDILDITN